MPEPQSFHEWLQERARACGYDIDAPRGGGRSKLADDAGVSRGQVGRALAGETVPDIGSQRGLAKALGVPLPSMLIRSGLAEPEDFPGLMGAPEPPSHSLDLAADRMHVTPQERRVLVAVVEATLGAMRDPEFTASIVDEAAAEAEADLRRS